DDRLHPKTFVLGVEYENKFIAFPLGTISEEPVLNYQNDDTNLLIIYNPNSNSGIAFNRQAGELILTFEIVEENKTITDAETGSIWNQFTGEAIEGAMTGTKLKRVKSTISFWFAWKDFYQDTLIYGIDS
ncbi:MAG: DUF3179 domain-containing protein, partial [Chloroflexota bacterium]